jgi:hypothetical protein
MAPDLAQIDLQHEMGSRSCNLDAFLGSNFGFDISGNPKRLQSRMKFLLLGIGAWSLEL